MQKLKNTFYSFRNFLFLVVFCTLFGIGSTKGASVVEDIDRLLDKDKRVEYLLVAQLEKLTQLPQTLCLTFGLKKPLVYEYGDAPSRLTEIISLKHMVTKLKKQIPLDLDTVLSLPGEEVVFVTSTKDISGEGVYSFDLRYEKKLLSGEFQDLVQGKKYNLRLLSIDKDGEDFLFFSPQEARVANKKNGKFTLTIKGITNGYRLKNHTKEVIKKKDFPSVFSSIKTTVYDLNGDLALFESGRYITFEIADIQFDQNDQKLILSIIPLKNIGNLRFFDSIKEERIIKGPIDLHIDPWFPCQRL